MGIFDKAKGAVKNYTNGLKEQEIGIFDKAKGAVKNYNLGKILDVYENKVVFTSTQSTSTVVTALLLGGSTTQGEKTIYYKDAIGVQYKPSTITDGYIQVETAAGGPASSSAYGVENSIQFSGKNNDEAKIIADYIRNKIEEIKNAPVGSSVQQMSPAEELKKFKELLDLGIITQAEFDAKKAQLLNL